MRIFIISLVFCSIVSAAAIAVAPADVSAKNEYAINKTLSNLGKIYDRCDNLRRDKVNAVKKLSASEEKKAEIAELINVAVSQIGKPEFSVFHMINLHTLHVAAEKLVEKESPSYKLLHDLYHKHAFVFQSDTFVRGFIFGSLGLIFLVAAYQGVLTSRKFA